MEFFPVTLPFPRMYSEDAATRTATELTHDILNQTPTIPLTMLGLKQTLALNKFAEIFNIAAPSQVPTPENAMLQRQKTPTPNPRMDIP